MKGIIWATVTDSIPVQNIFEVAAKHLHVTLMFGIELTEELAQTLGREVQIVVVANCHNHEIQALLVEGLDGWDKPNQHITLSMVEGVPPFKSNAMLEGPHESEALDLVLRGRIEFFEFKNPA